MPSYVIGENWEKASVAMPLRKQIRKKIEKEKDLGIVVNFALTPENHTNEKENRNMYCCGQYMYYWSQKFSSPAGGETFENIFYFVDY